MLLHAHTGPAHCNLYIYPYIVDIALRKHIQTLVDLDAYSEVSSDHEPIILRTRSNRPV